MNTKRRLLIVVTACASIAIVTLAWASETLTARLRFEPDKLNAPTNLSVRAKFHTTTGAVPSPVTYVTAYLPAGMRIDLRGAGACNAHELEEQGPEACPGNSRIGFGGGMGLLEIAKDVIHEPFTLDLFLGPRRNGHVVVLGYVNASSPASFQIVVSATEFRASKPFGIGFRFHIPLIPTLPGASNASVESAFVTIGDDRVAYYKRVHGRRTLVHLRGIVTPRRCPHGGFPYKALVSFEDGSSLTAEGAIPCPHR